jgi:hypothetical protein
MKNEDEWIKKKIKGNFGEAIFKLHFSLMFQGELGSFVRQVGFEKIFEGKNEETSQRILLNPSKIMGIISKNILNSFRRTPDFLVSSNAYFLFFEVKFREKNCNLETFSLDLLWQYRKNIINERFAFEYLKLMDLRAIKPIGEEKWIEIKLNWEAENVDLEVKKALKTFIERNYDEVRILNKPPIFYLVSLDKPNGNSYINTLFGGVPFKWWEAGNKNYDKEIFSFYRGFNKYYVEIIEPLIEEVKVRYEETDEEKRVHFLEKINFLIERFGLNTRELINILRDRKNEIDDAIRFVEHLSGERFISKLPIT